MLNINDFEDNGKENENAAENNTVNDVSQENADTENEIIRESDDVTENGNADNKCDEDIYEETVVIRETEDTPSADSADSDECPSEPSAEKPSETASIRYDKDKTSGDGSYVWQYCDESEDNSPKKSGAVMILGIIGLCVAVIALTVVATSSVIKYKNSKIAQSDEKPVGSVIEEHIGTGDSGNGIEESGTNGTKPVIGANRDNGANRFANEEKPAEDGVLSKQMIAVKCMPSAVGIEVSATTRSYFGSYKSSGVGSGFILTEDGYIATNNHVVEGADEINVMLEDGTKYPAEIIGTDSLTDLAVIKIEAKGLVPMEIGDSDLMRVGDSVIAIGTPAGIEFAGTVTDGIVSAINRNVEVQSSSGSKKTMTLMQTNAAINPGNSGGPLINNKGQVIGINTLKLTEKYEGIGFSIPINSAVDIFNQLIQDGKVTNYDHSFVTGNGAIGITNYVEVTEAESEYYGIPVGVMVVQLKLGSSAQKAGLKRGDIITAFNGQKVATVEEINKLKSAFRAGDEVTLTVYRDPEETIDITFNLDVME